MRLSGLACIPSKALLRPGEVLEAARQIGGERERIEGDRVIDEKAVFARRDAFTSRR
jgi:pyruvate/2-oxoglutarate dehydrogenase complex dihydrolipoamide dehydrogenase (E3) component